MADRCQLGGGGLLGASDGVGVVDVGGALVVGLEVVGDGAGTVPVAGSDRARVGSGRLLVRGADGAVLVRGAGVAGPLVGVLGRSGVRGADSPGAGRTRK